MKRHFDSETFRAVSYIKISGVLVVNSENSPKSYQDPVLWAWLEICLSSQSYQILQNTLSPVGSIS